MIAWVALSSNSPKYELSYAQHSRFFELPKEFPVYVKSTIVPINPNDGVVTVRTKVWNSGNQQVDKSITDGTINITYPAARRVIAARITNDNTVGQVMGISCSVGACAVHIGRLVKDMGFAVTAILESPNVHAPQNDDMEEGLLIDQPEVARVSIASNTVVRTFPRSRFDSNIGYLLWAGLLVPPGLLLIVSGLAFLARKHLKNLTNDKEGWSLSKLIFFDSFAPNKRLFANVVNFVFVVYTIVFAFALLYIPSRCFYLIFLSPSPPF